MGLIYFPSCKFTAKYPQLSMTIKSYLREVFGAEIAGCCRPSLNKIRSDDTLVYVCNTCATFFKEGTRAGRVLSLWELMLRDKNFRYPEHQGQKVTVQDCWRTYDNRPEQDAARELLRRMNLEIVELKENYEKTRFCGYSLYEPLPPSYDQLAPKRFGLEAQGLFLPHTEEEKKLRMQQHCEQIQTEEVVCTCVACVNGINLGGKRGKHLAELLFGHGA